MYLPFKLDRKQEYNTTNIWETKNTIKWTSNYFTTVLHFSYSFKLLSVVLSFLG